MKLNIIRLLRNHRLYAAGMQVGDQLIKSKVQPGHLVRVEIDMEQKKPMLIQYWIYDNVDKIKYRESMGANTLRGYWHTDRLHPINTPISYDEWSKRVIDDYKKLGVDVEMPTAKEFFADMYITVDGNGMLTAC